MRVLTILIVGFALFLLVPAVQADNYNQVVNDPLVQIHHDRTFPHHYPTCLLQVSPMILEIKDVNDKALADERALLAELVTAKEEIVAMRIVHRIEQLEYDRQIDVLRIQSRYARLDGRLDLEKKIKSLILEIMEQDLARVEGMVW